MYKVIALFGEAGAGKDSVLNAICTNPKVKHLLNPIISCTTRPPREGEKDGVNYYFLSVEDFTSKLMNDEMIEACEFNEWYYGTPYSSLDEHKVNIGVFNLSGIEELSKDKNIDLYAYYIDVSDKSRLIRQLNRESNPNVFEIIRRFKADCADFACIEFYYNILHNETKKDFKNCIKILSADIKNLYCKPD